MVRRGGVMSTAIVAFAIAGLVRADMMPVASLGADTDGGHRVTSVGNPLQAMSSELPFAFPGLDTWASYSIDLQAVVVAEKAVEGPTLQVLVDGSNSFDLCLYALVSLGVLRSGHWVRRPSLGFVPEWYQGVALSLIGHGGTVGADVLRPAVACFIQPDGRIDPSIPQQRRGTITCLWRCSSFTPAVLASRAPPYWS
jgi:hypothetical protein